MPQIWVSSSTYERLKNLREHYENLLAKDSGKRQAVNWSVIIADLLDDAQKFREAQGE